ncbi:protein kinase family protein [Reinekea sp.]|uniref:protein kinase family protein n=1 Tax=Reinekea sp. TaxID=1970455 RepID=UPI002A815B5F|nr:protein kinase family protein [Reinekea sp.]
MEHNLKHFYIPEEQSIYLLSHQDAAKLKGWIKLCIRQLERLGYQDIALIGKGAFGFVFGGKAASGLELVFKFSRINLPQHVQDRLEEESQLQSLLQHPGIPRVIEYVRVGKQRILMMTRAPGRDLDWVSLQRGGLSPRLLVKIASQLAELLLYLRTYRTPAGQLRPIVHGDIKPSNLVFDAHSETIQLVDWGSSVFAQTDSSGQFLANNVMDLMSTDLQSTNAKLGDVYFIGDDQLNGRLSNPRFDEQGAVATLYALASGQSARFGNRVITALSLGLPLEMARILERMMGPDVDLAQRAADYYLAHMGRLKHLVVPELPEPEAQAQLPVWIGDTDRHIDTVVYSSRKSFLREQHPDIDVDSIADEQLDKYYKNYLQGMGATEKAFIAAVSRLGRYPMVGGLTVKWGPKGVRMESAFSLFDVGMKRSFVQSVNNTVALGRALYREGTFKAVMYDARDTLHIDRVRASDVFVVPKRFRIPYRLTPAPKGRLNEKMHSYFEDGRDPDEHLVLPASIMVEIEALDQIHHTGCIIFEALPKNLKIHNYYSLLDPAREAEFKQRLYNLLQAVGDIEGVGIGGFMKMPYKDSRFFQHLDHAPEHYYPKAPVLRS